MLESLCQRTGDKSSSNSQTLDPGKTMRFSFWSWNTGPAHYPFKNIQGFMIACQLVYMWFMDLEYVPLGVVVILWVHWAITSSLHWGICNSPVAGMRINIFESCFSAGKKWSAHFGLWTICCYRCLRLGIAPAVVGMLYKSAVMKRQLSVKAKLPVYQ